MSSFKKKVEKSYDRTSNTYNDFMKYDVENQSILPTYNQLFSKLKIPSNPKTLDIGCGTGISTFEIAKKFNNVGQFYGIDFSAKMIQKANETASSYGYKNFLFSKGDAEQLDFPDSFFDIVTSCYTIHFIPDKQKAIQEMHRILKPNGQVALLYHGLHHINEVLSLLSDLGDKYPEYLGDIDWKDVVGKFISLEETHEIFNRIGFYNVSIYGIHEIAYVDPSSFMNGLDTVFSFWQEGLSIEVVDMLRCELVKNMNSASTSKGFKRTRYDIYAYGRKPE
jgi:ubiquinone/menaquinone biosynthesis C-methylase UbiE